MLQGHAGVVRCRPEVIAVSHAREADSGALRLADRGLHRHTRSDHGDGTMSVEAGPARSVGGDLRNRRRFHHRRQHVTRFDHH